MCFNPLDRGNPNQIEAESWVTKLIDLDVSIP